MTAAPTRPNPMFHPTNRAPETPLSGTTKKFTGDGTPYLVVAGLMSVTEIRIGRMLLPEFRDMEFPGLGGGDNYKRTQRQSWPLYQLVTDDQGDRVLLRAIISNNGIWQKGELIYVTGEWDEEKAAPVGTVENRLGASSDEQLQRMCLEYNLAAPPGQTFSRAEMIERLVPLVQALVEGEQSGKSVRRK